MAGRVGIYAGSFDPFHKGHKSLLDDASTLFDKIIVLVACNPEKPSRMFGMSESLGMVSVFIQGREGFDLGMMGNDASPGKLASDLGGALLLRGIREVTDMDYERRLATFNRELFGIQTVFLMARPELAHINGTAIRQLKRLGLDYQRYL